MPRPAQDRENNAARAWVRDQLRVPQRAPRTTAVLDWSAVSPGTRYAVEALASAGLDVDPTTLITAPSWWASAKARHRGEPALTVPQRDELAEVYTALNWRLTEEGPEIRLVAIAERITERIAQHPARREAALTMHRSPIGSVIELHTIAAAARELLTMRLATPPMPYAEDAQVHRAREEWDRRQALFAQAENALVNRVAILRAYEAALDPLHASLRNLASITAMWSGGQDVDRLYAQIAGNEIAAEMGSGPRNEVTDLQASIDAQISYLDSMIRPAIN